jgi:hypothetical protein
MRLWSLHPRYLDAKGLVALWREGLLARAVLAGQTKGYRSHPQLLRFLQQPDPLAAIDAYLLDVAREATRRGYRFDQSKLGDGSAAPRICVTDGQLSFELKHLRIKLEGRAPKDLERISNLKTPESHPSFRIIPGPRAEWEKGGALQKG